MKIEREREELMVAKNKEEDGLGLIFVSIDEYPKSLC